MSFNPNEIDANILVEALQDELSHTQRQKVTAMAQANAAIRQLAQAEQENAENAQKIREMTAALAGLRAEVEQIRESQERTESLAGDAVVEGTMAD